MMGRSSMVAVSMASSVLTRGPTSVIAVGTSNGVAPGGLLHRHQKPPGKRYNRRGKKQDTSSDFTDTIVSLIGGATFPHSYLAYNNNNEDEAAGADKLPELLGPPRGGHSTKMRLKDHNFFMEDSQALTFDHQILEEVEPYIPAIAPPSSSDPSALVMEWTPLNEVSEEDLKQLQTQPQPQPSTEVSEVLPKTGTKRSSTKYAKQLKNRNHVNYSRKLTHAAFGIFFGALNYVVPRKIFLPAMTIITSATLAVELLRYRPGFGWMNDAMHKVLGSALRKHEMDGKFTGSFYYFLGVTATSYLFPTVPATLGICQLAIADPSASYFGKRTRHIYWSRIGNELGGFGRNKGVLGFLGGAVSCVPLNYRLLSMAKMCPSGSTVLSCLPGGKFTLLWASLALGLAGSFADLAVPTPSLTMPDTVMGVSHIPPFHLDDNFVVPIFAGFACTKIFSSLGWPQELIFAASQL